MPGACNVLIKKGRTALQCLRSLDAPSKVTCKDFVIAAGLVVVGKNVVVLGAILDTIGVGLDSIIQVMLAVSLESATIQPGECDDSRSMTITIAQKME